MGRASFQRPRKSCLGDRERQAAQIWVKLPILFHDRDTRLYISCDSDGSEGVPPGEMVRARDVWRDFLGVWHFESFSESAAGYAFSVNQDLASIGAPIAESFGSSARLEAGNGPKVRLQQRTRLACAVDPTIHHASVGSW
jgi:hypothetical protein